LSFNGKNGRDRIQEEGKQDTYEIRGEEGRPGEPSTNDYSEVQIETKNNNEGGRKK